MGDPTGDERPEPSLELPSLFRRRRRAGPPAPAPEPEAEAEAETPTRPLYVDETPAPSRPAPAPVQVAVEAPPAPTPAQPPPPAHPRRASRSGPLLPAPLAAALTGLVVGAVGTGLTYGGLEGCSMLRGTESCGGPGLLLLVAIVAVMALLGAVLLAMLGVPDARGTSTLGTGLVCVVAMVALLEVVFSGWMFVAVPLIGAAAYVLAQWVTTRIYEQVEEGPGVDVR